MDSQTSGDTHPGHIALEENMSREGNAQGTVKQDASDEKSVRAEKYAYYSFFAANNGIGPYQ